MDRIGIWMSGKLTTYMFAVAAIILLALPTVISEGMVANAFLEMVIIFIATIAMFMLAIK